MTNERIAELRELCAMSSQLKFYNAARSALPECLEEIERLRGRGQSLDNKIRYKDIALKEFAEENIILRAQLEEAREVMKRRL